MFTHLFINNERREIGRETTSILLENGGENFTFVHIEYSPFLELSDCAEILLAELDSPLLEQDVQHSSFPALAETDMFHSSEDHTPPFSCNFFLVCLITPDILIYLSSFCVCNLANATAATATNKEENR